MSIEHTSRTIVTLGKNIGVRHTPAEIRTKHDHLSPESKINAFAAGLSWQEGTTIIFSTGQTAGASIPSEAQLMKGYLKRVFPNIPDSDIILEEKSIDTAGNAEEVSKILKAKGVEDVTLLSTGFHVGNAKILFERYGVKVRNVIVSEKVMKEHSRHPDRVRTYFNSDIIKKERKKELVRRILLSTIDPKGKILRWFTSRSRK